MARGDLPLERENNPVKQFTFSIGIVTSLAAPKELKKKIAVLKEHCTTLRRDYKPIQYSIVLPCIITASEEDVNQILSEYKRNDKTIKQ